jgi:hypothetical protein
MCWTPLAQDLIIKEEIEDTKGVIRFRKSNKKRQRNGQRKKDKQKFTKHTHTTKNPLTRTPLNTGVNSVAPEGWTIKLLLL